MVGADFEIGDLVWAKMKNFPFWPAKIVNPPPDAKSTSKRAQHYVFFFGTENHAWILDENIVHHSEEMLLSSSKKKSTTLKQAIDKIITESQKIPSKKKPLVEKRDESDMQAGTSSGSSSERRIGKSQRGKSKYESAKKKYFVKVQKASQNQYLTKMHKKVRKKYFTDKKSSKLKEGCSSNEMNGELLEGVLRTFCGKIQTTKKKIGFLGLGKMGQKIVKKLIESDHNVTVWNRTKSKCAEFVDLGAQCGVSPASVVAKCDVTFCCVSGPDAVKTLAFAADGILAGFEGTREKGYVELTTVDPLTAEEIAEAIGHKGGKYLESPLTESKRPGSESLVAVCAGEYELFRTCESCFFAFASDAYFLSSTIGSGSNMNLLLSMVMNTVYAGLAESLALIRKLNLPQESLLEFMKYSPLNCYLLQKKGEIMMSSDEFFIDNIFKYQQRDLSLALAIADSCEQPVQITAAANEFYKRPIHLLFE